LSGHNEVSKNTSLSTTTNTNKRADIISSFDFVHDIGTSSGLYSIKLLDREVSEPACADPNVPTHSEDNATELLRRAWIRLAQGFGFWAVR